MGRVKLQISVPDEMVERIDRIANEMGMTRSQLCAFFIGNSVRQTEMQTNAIASLSSTIAPVLEQALKEEQEKKLAGAGE